MITYRIDVVDPNTHMFRVTLTIAKPQPDQRLSLPVWIPGSYLVREFARHLSPLQAHQGGVEVPLSQVDKATWQARCGARGALRITYGVYAFDTSVRAAFLDSQRGFFNGTSLCLRVEGQEAKVHRLQLGTLPRGWQVATALRAVSANGAGQGVYEAADYDELVDHPVELGRFWRGHFEAAGVPHEFVVAGALPDFDGERLLADTRRICEAQIAFWHGTLRRSTKAGARGARAGRAPFDRYVFLLNTAEDGHGGLEHRASTALLASRRDLPARPRADTKAASSAHASHASPPDTSDGYASLLGLISHEYFHTWNVKRLRPADFAQYDYTRENYTELLWFFEGFTSYYDDLFLLRTGLIDEARYLRLLGKTITSVQATPGRQVQSVAQSSFDAWVKYYRADENTPNATVSYYTKGSLVALALDLTLRAEGASLDAVMRALWKSSSGGPIGQADILAALQQVSGRSYARELNDWVQGTDELPLPPLLRRAGIEWQAQAATLAQRWGLRVSESALTGIKVSHVLRGGAAERAGLAAGDELLAVAGWRLRRLEDAQRVLTAGSAVEVLAVRDQRVLTLTLNPPESTTVGGPVTLSVPPAATGASTAVKTAQALRQAWFSGKE